MITGFRAIRVLHYAVLICLEATLIHLIGVVMFGVTSAPFRWWVLAVILSIAAIATSRLEPINADPSHIRFGTAALALVVITWATAAHQGGYSPLGVVRTLPRLFALDNERFLAVYLGLIASLWAWWRGTSVLEQGHSEVMRIVRRGVVSLGVVLIAVGIAGYDPIFGSAAGTPQIGLVVEVCGFLLLCFVALSLTRIVEAATHSTHGAEWRWLRSSLASTSVVVLLGLLLFAFLADPAGSVLREIFQWVVYGMVILMSPLIAVMLLLVQFIRQLIPQRQGIPPIEALATATPDTTTVPTTITGLSSTLLAIPTIILLLLPIVALLLVILFARRRRGRVDLETGEERESIFSWGALRTDLADLLRGLRRPATEDGLRGVLRRMLAEDPVTRIRRRYVQLLLRGEAAGRQRPPHQTPHEFAPSLTQEPDDEQAINTLTDIYQQARYAPATVDATAAAEADRIWKTLDSEEPPRRG